MVDRPLILPGVLDPGTCARVQEAMTRLPAFALVGPMRSHGTLLAPTEGHPRGPALADHAATCAEVDATLRRVAPELEPRVLAELAGLHGLPVERFGPGYGFATLRVLPPGASAPPHADRYRPEGAWAAREASLDDPERWSWYLVLDAPQRGGELVLEDGEAFAAPQGALLTFCASRWIHRVAEVEGPRARVTLGGFEIGRAHV
jgi:hypothetical protein